MSSCRGSRLLGGIISSSERASSSTLSLRRRPKSATTRRKNRVSSTLFPVTTSCCRRKYRSSSHDVASSTTSRKRSSLSCFTSRSQGVIGRTTFLSSSSISITKTTSASSSSTLTNIFSLDKLISLIVIGGCSTLIVQAYYEGYEPLQGQVFVAASAAASQHDSSTSLEKERDDLQGRQQPQQRGRGHPGRIVLTPTLCEKLSKDGYLIIDNFLSKKEIQNAIQDSLTIPWKSNPNYNNNDDDDENSSTDDDEVKVRTDQVYFLDTSSRRTIESYDDDDQNRSIQNHLDVILNDNHRHRHRHHRSLYKIHNLFHEIGQAIIQSSFNGFEEKYVDDDDYDDDNNDRINATRTAKNDDDDNNYSPTKLAIPTKMQISRYDKKKSSSSTRRRRKQTTKPTANDDKNREEEEVGGGYYHAHLDSSYNDSILDLGLLGYLRSEYLRRRYITCIIYLNPNWKDIKSDGGCLRIYHHHDNNNNNNNNNNGSGSNNKNGRRSDSINVHDGCVGVGDVANQNNNPSAPTYVDIEPVAGRLVIFDSRQILHEVRPTFQPRLACSVWLTMNS